MNSALGSWKRRLKYLPLVIPVLGLAELALHFYFARRAPTKADWDAVRPLVASWYKPGEVVLIAPQWAEPMARWSFGDALMPARELARADTTGYREALEVATLGSRSPELAGWKVVRETKHGSFTVRELSNPASPVVTYDFADHVDAESAEVQIVHGPTLTPCTFTTTATVESGGLGGPPTYPASRFTCPGQPSHIFVGLTIIEDGNFRPRRCIWSHPPPAGSEIVTRFRAVPLGNKIRVFTGMRWVTERDMASPPFIIEVTVGGEKVGHVEHRDGDWWKLDEVNLGAWAGKKADVEFHVSSAGGGSHACFTADSR